MAYPWLGNVISLLALAAMVVVRIPYDRRREFVGFAAAPMHALDRVLIGGMMLGIVLLPLLNLVLGWPISAARPQSLPLFSCGGMLMMLAVRLFARAHSDLGDNWSPVVELRSEHALVTQGVYARMRHPMYTSLLIAGVAQTLLIPNWVAGFSGLAASLLLCLGRLEREERMMIERFGDAYRQYATRTSRVIPGIW